ncbi:MAG: ImmA/IrrE family metallo-endopeptidase [Lacticaseibacillus songhuajiangensis]|jgi:hypothetical protein|nr:ImmA/IrrE family metallo-endopeptidase [Lacticaseibacillus songhuajiangensis]
MTINDYLDQLLDMAAVYGIRVGILEPLSPITPCASNSATKRIVFNPNFHDPKQLPYQLAHEITHVLNGDSSVLYFTPTKRGIEGDANKGAVQILVRMYFDGVEPDAARVDDFMSCFGITSDMRDYCVEATRDFYKNR